MANAVGITTGENQTIYMNLSMSALPTVTPNPAGTLAARTWTAYQTALVNAANLVDFTGPPTVSERTAGREVVPRIGHAVQPTVATQAGAPEVSFTKALDFSIKRDRDLYTAEFKTVLFGLLVRTGDAAQTLRVQVGEFDVIEDQYTPWTGCVMKISLKDKWVIVPQAA